MRTEQIAVRVPHELVVALDDLVARGRFESRADAVRAGIVVVTRAEAERAIDVAIVDGYRRHPPSVADDAAAMAALREAIADEPW